MFKKFAIYLILIAVIIANGLFTMPRSVSAGAVTATYIQEEFQFYDDSTGTGLNDASAYGGAAEKGSLTNFTIGGSVRLRYSSNQTANKPTTNLSFVPKLQYKASATACGDDTGFVDVPTQTACGSSPICRDTSGKFADGDLTTNRLTITGDVFLSGGDGIETDGAPATVGYTSGTTNKEQTEYEWMLKVTSNAAGSTPYSLRMVYTTDAEMTTYTVCAVIETQALSAPTVTVQDPDSVSYTTLTANGDITATGGQDATDRGFVYDIADRGDSGNNDPSATSWTYVASTTGTFTTGPFTEDITGLDPNTLYYFRSFAKNPQGYDYSNTAVSTTTLNALAAVTSSAATDVGSASATANGNITSAGATTPTYRGFVYGETTQSDPGNVATSSSGYTFVTEENGSFDTGNFSLPLSNLDPETTYYYRAYVYNSYGFDYSDTEQFFTTLESKTLGNMPYALRVTDSNTAEFIIINSGSWHAATSTTNINDGSWHHIAATYDGADMKLYINGSLEDTYSGFSGAIPVNSKEFRIGGDYEVVASSTTHGVLDEVRMSKTARSADWISAQYTNQNTPGTFITWGALESGGGPVSHWAFDEGYASTTYDSIGGNNGTLMSNTGWSEGRFGKALSFDGVDDYVNVTDATGTSSLDVFNFTLSSWIKTATTTNDRKYIFAKRSGTSDSYALTLADQKGVVEIQNSGNFYRATSTAVINDNQWHAISATYDGASLQLYIDGALKDTSAVLSGNLNYADGDLRIGADYQSTAARFFHGLIDDAKIFNRALSAQEIAGLYVAGGGQDIANVAVGVGFANRFGEYSDVEQYLVGYWKLDETTIGTAQDWSGFNNHGTDSNTAASSIGKYGYARQIAGTGESLVTIEDVTSLDTAQVTVGFWIKKFSICEEATVSDIDSNTYDTVTIGFQCWLAENLRATTRPDGQGLGKGPATHGGGGWTTDLGYYSCPPNSSNDGEDCAASATLGMVYQWSAAMASSTAAGAQGLCPDGWHIPTDEQLMTLEETLGMCSGAGAGCSGADGYRGTDQGSRLAGHAADQNWTTGILTDDADFDTSGFDLPPSGYRSTGSGYYYRAYDGLLWSSSESSATRRLVDYGNAAVDRGTGNKAYGFSVRCLKD